MVKSYKHLTHNDRYSIEHLLRANYSLSRIAKVLGFNKSSISRELKRNKNVTGEYYYHIADKRYKKRLKSKGLKSKISRNSFIKKYIHEHLVKDKWSPEQISGRLKLEYNINISLHSIYRYIAKDKLARGTLYTNLRHPNKNSYNRKKTKKTYDKIKGKKSINLRPDLANKKSRLGDFEGDLVEVSKKAYILTLTDRKSKYLITNKVKSKNSDEVHNCVVDAFCYIDKDLLKTITFDNGFEFSKFKKIEESLKTEVYFADPYSSWQRGLNEHTNGLIRQFVPKRGKYKATNITYKKLEEIENLLNNRPRKILNYKTPAEVFYNSS